MAGSEILLLEAAWDLYVPKRAEGDCVSSSMILEHLDAWQGQCLVLTIVVILAIEWLGRNLSLWLVMKAFGTKTARFYDTRITAIGVIHHELSHLLVAIFTGARIDGVKLYKIFQKQDDEVLGYVNYTSWPLSVSLHPADPHRHCPRNPRHGSDLHHEPAASWVLVESWQ